MTSAEVEARREGHDHDGGADWCHPGCPLQAALPPVEVGYAAHRCQVCSAAPALTVTRRGDVAVSWSCADASHLFAVIERLLERRAGDEVVVTRFRG